MKPILSINLSHIRDNYLYIKNNTKSMVSAAIKADAYGLGVSIIAPVLYNHGCRNFFVATLDEAVSARKYLAMDARIFILHGISSQEIDIVLQYALIPMVNNIEQLDIMVRNADVLYAVHIDTGMNRLGFFYEDILLGKITFSSNLCFFISHLANDSSPQNIYNDYQRNNFINATKAYSHIPKSLVSSSGVFLGPDYHFDMVRPGAVIYGIGSSINSNIKNPITLVANILHIHECIKDEYVGYGSTYLAKSGSILATIPIGYADGFRRDFSNKGQVMIHGALAPIVGIVSMDLTIIDITHIAQKCKIGDEVFVINDVLSPDILASTIGTVSYEIITSLKLGRYSTQIINDV